MCEQSSNRQNRRYCCEGIGYSCQINGGVEFAHGTEQLTNLQKTITSLIEEDNTVRYRYDDLNLKADHR
jgi:hypothetical protein